MSKQTTGAYTLQNLRALCTREKCRWCGAKLPQEIESYPHDGGYVIDGYDSKQWAFITCRSCDYGWSLWKLGAPSPQSSSDRSK